MITSFSLDFQKENYPQKKLQLMIILSRKKTMCKNYFKKSYSTSHTKETNKSYALIDFTFDRKPTGSRRNFIQNGFQFN